MAQLTIRINGYAYTVGCEDGQEAHLQAMAADVENRINSIKAIGGQSGEAKLLVLSALLMADELHDMRLTLGNLQSEIARGTSAGGSRRLAKLAERAEAIAAGLEQT